MTFQSTYLPANGHYSAVSPAKYKPRQYLLRKFFYYRYQTRTSWDIYSPSFVYMQGQLQVSPIQLHARWWWLFNPLVYIVFLMHRDVRLLSPPQVLKRAYIFQFFVNKVEHLGSHSVVWRVMPPMEWHFAEMIMTSESARADAAWVVVFPSCQQKLV